MKMEVRKLTENPARKVALSYLNTETALRFRRPRPEGGTGSLAALCNAMRGSERHPKLRTPSEAQNRSTLDLRQISHPSCGGEKRQGGNGATLAGGYSIVLGSTHRPAWSGIAVHSEFVKSSRDPVRDRSVRDRSVRYCTL